jgi:hypothetical protein
VSGVISKIVDAAQDEHVYVSIRTPDRPTLSIDISNSHGRRVLSLRVDGMGVAGFLVDVIDLEAMNNDGEIRWCPFCGEKIEMFSSATHVCSEQKGF